MQVVDAALLSPMKSKRNVLVSLGWYDPRLIEGIGRYAREAGWHLEMRAMIEASVPKGWKGDGMLANDTAVPRMARFFEAQAHRQPTVLIGSNHLSTDLPSVKEDNEACGRIAAEHFMDRGYRHFAWVSLQRGTPEHERRKAFTEALRVRGYECTLLEWSQGRGRRKDNWENAREWLASELLKLPKPLGVFALDDLLALDTVQACLDSGLSVPADVAVLGVANMELACECSQVPLSSIDENLTEIAYRAARLLDEWMNSGTPPKGNQLVPIKGLVVRQSTDTFAITDPALSRAAAYMAEHFQRNISMEDVAHHTDISLRALHYTFQRGLQTTPGQHLLRIRMDRARELVEQGGEKIGTIAVNCGFLTLRNFHRAFIKEFGMPPAAYRNRLRGETELTEPPVKQPIVPRKLKSSAPG